MAKAKSPVVEISSYGAAIMHYLQDEMVEVYCGDAHTTFKFSDCDMDQKSVVRGRIIDLMGDCLVVECYDKGTGKSNHVFLNCWSIVSIVPVNGGLRMKDVYWDEERTVRRHR